MAAAATIMVGLGLGALLLSKDRPEPAGPAPMVARKAEVSLPYLDRSEQVASAQVTVGIPSGMTPAMMSALFLADQRHGGGRGTIQPAGEPRDELPFE